MSRSGGRMSTTVMSIPSAISVSVPTGRCGPCCSTAASGSTAIVASGSTAPYSVARYSPQQAAAVLRHAKLPHAGPAAMTSTSTLNSGRAKPETIISVEAGGGSPTSRSRTAM